MKRFLILLIFILTLFSCVSTGIYGSSNVLKSNKWDCIVENMTLIKTVTEVQVGKDVVVHSRTGIGIGLENGYVLALTHTTKEKEGKVTITIEDVTTEITVKIINSKHYIGEHQITLIGRDNDISIFKTHLLFEGLHFADASEMIIGREVITRGWSLAAGFNVKRGIISLVDLMKGCYGNTNGYMLESFVTTIPTNPGDSGSPVLIYNTKKSRYEIIGVTWAVRSENQGLSFAFRVDSIQNSIKKILNEI